ncbi:hypothetical protein OG949_41085 (plasmid) [Streptomyces scopuliridis]|uniref:hypothetical protein n=1 Tax=Streptomyces scopuliridis TaxID=452529 RepID=UPI002DDA8905|nr:hypothetical protein [Streptomyces scopuliridis]WSB39138.1 hypothetical protein OG949_41085 [Streptomyces scopuliridis]
MNNTPCGSHHVVPRPLTLPEVVVVVVIVIAATFLALAGLQVLSLIVLVAEAAVLSVRLLRQLRGNSRAEQGIAEA